MVFLQFQFLSTLNTFSVAKFGQVSYFCPNLQLIQIFCYVKTDIFVSQHSDKDIDFVLLYSSSGIGQRRCFEVLEIEIVERLKSVFFPKLSHQV